VSAARLVLLIAVAAAAAAAGAALASGGPPPPDPPAQPAQTIVAHGSGRVNVAAPARRSDATIERAVQTARVAAMPRAIAAAQAEARALARAAGLGLGAPVAISRDASPYGYWDPDGGRFGPGRWCGTITSFRTVRRADGTRKRIRRSHRGCPVPRDATVRLTVTFATSGA